MSVVCREHHIKPSAITPCRVQFPKDSCPYCRIRGLERYNELLSRQRDSICYRLEEVWDVGAGVIGDIMSWEWVDQSQECVERLTDRIEELEKEVERLKPLIHNPMLKVAQEKWELEAEVERLKEENRLKDEKYNRNANEYYAICREPLEEAIKENTKLQAKLDDQDAYIKTMSAHLMKQTDKIIKYEKSFEVLPELIRDATNHSSCQDCTVEKKMEYVHEYISKTLEAE